MSEKVLNQILSEITAMKTNMATKQGLESLEKKINNISDQVAKSAENITDIKDNQKTIANVVDKMAAV